jgi:hypothetical protein
VDASGRGEAGGLQFTGQQLGSSLGVALLGAIVLSGLTSAFVTNISNDPAISAEVATQVGTAVGSGIDFVSSDQVAAAATQAGLDEATTTALVGDYESAQLQSLKAGLLAAGLLALVSLAFTSELPHTKPGGERSPPSSPPWWGGARLQGRNDAHYGFPRRGQVQGKVVCNMASI